MLHYTNLWTDTVTIHDARPFSETSGVALPSDLATVSAKPSVIALCLSACVATGGGVLTLLITRVQCFSDTARDGAHRGSIDVGNTAIQCFSTTKSSNFHDILLQVSPL